MPIGNSQTKRLRTQAGLTQQGLGKLCGVDTRTISRIENRGKINEQTIARVAAGLSQALGKDVTLESLLISKKDERQLIKENLKSREELSNLARRKLKSAESNRTFIFPSLVADLGLNQKTLLGLMNGDTVSSKFAQNIIDILDDDGRFIGEVHRSKSVDFSRMLRGETAEQRITNKDLAERLGVSVRTVEGWESGKTYPSPKNLSKLVEILDLHEEQISRLGIHKVEMPSKIEKELTTKEDAQSQALVEIAASIPAQNPLIRFEVSPDNKLELVPSLNNENDYEIIAALRSELLASDGPIATLKERYATNPNLPQSSFFKPLTAGYDKELSKDPREINYAVLYAKGARFYAARRTAAQQVVANEWPELGADEADAIDAICDLHGPLIMASAVGRRMVSDAHEYETTPDVYREEQEIIEEFGQVLSAETEIFEAETAEDIRALTPSIENDPQPARTRRAGILVAGSVLTVVVGGAAWLAGGSAALYISVPVAAGYWGQKYAWEVLKKTDAFKDSSDADAKRTDAFIRKAEQQVGPHQKTLMEKMSKVVETHRPLFEKVANLRPEFGWAKKFIFSDKTKSQTKLVDLGKVVREAASLMVHQARSDKTKLTESGLTATAFVAGDSDKLLQAFTEIIVNALNHGKGGDEVKISLHAIDFANDGTPSTYIVSISNNGPVIREDMIDKIFEMGWTTSQSGAGVGLALVKRIFEEHSGNISVTSERNTGTTFMVSLPALIT
jgi:transcriptional regulator with XRE-family HTH domain